MLDKITWPVVAVIGMALAAIVALNMLHAPTGDILSVLALMGLGAGASQLSSLKTNLNGNLSRLLDLVESAQNKLAASPPVTESPVIDGAVVESSEGK